MFQDGGGVWHEHVVTETDESREEARVLNTVIAENSLCETNGDYVEDLRNQNMAASAAFFCEGAFRDQVGAGRYVKPGS